jgi:hypothetical protein
MTCYNASPILNKVTIVDNRAGYGGGGLHCNANSNPRVVNSILWSNSPQEIDFYHLNDPNSLTIAFSDVRDGLSGVLTNGNGIVNWLDGNNNVTPLFVDTLRYDSENSHFRVGARQHKGSEGPGR